MRSPIIFILAFVILGAAVRAQLQVERVINPGTPYPGGCGRAMTSLGDVDGDGVVDYAVGCPDEAFTLGRVRAYSGATGAEIWQAQPTGGTRGFGYALTCIDDVTGDGIAEVGVGAPFSDTVGTDNGAAFVLDGATGAFLQTFAGFDPGDRLGYSLASFTRPDNGITYLACGLPERNGGGGGFRVYEAQTGVPVMDFGYLGSGEGGYAMAHVGDLNGDGAPDLAVALPRATNSAGGRGEVRVYSMNTFTSANLIAIVHGGAGFNDFGTAVDGCGDVDGDGLDDMVVGGPEGDLGATDTGLVHVCAGPFGSLIRAHAGAAQSRLGQAVCGVGDLDGDGYGDYAAGAPEDNNLFEAAGCVMVWSGYDGSVLGQLQGPAAWIGYGNTVALAGDFDQDGMNELLAGNGDDGVAHVIGFDPTYAGSQEDLCLRTGIDGRATTWPDVKDVTPLLQGAPLTLELDSPGGAYAFTPPALIAWLKPTGAPAASLPGYPEVHLDVNALILIFEPSAFAPIGPALLPASGMSLAGTLPLGLGGTSLVVQGFALAPSAQQSNPIFTATDAHEIRFQ